MIDFDGDTSLVGLHLDAQHEPNPVSEVESIINVQNMAPEMGQFSVALAAVCHESRS